MQVATSASTKPAWLKSPAVVFRWQGPKAVPILVPPIWDPVTNEGLLLWKFCCSRSSTVWFSAACTP